MTAFGAYAFAASCALRYVVALIAALAAILLGTTASASTGAGAVSQTAPVPSCWKTDLVVIQ